MTGKDLTNEELRAALASADRHMRLPWLSMLLALVPMAVATSFGLDAADLSDPTHVLILSGFAWLFSWTFFGGSLLQARQLAANARILRALELIDVRLRDNGADA